MIRGAGLAVTLGLLTSLVRAPQVLAQDPPPAETAHSPEDLARRARENAARGQEEAASPQARDDDLRTRERPRSTLGGRIRALGERTRDPKTPTTRPKDPDLHAPPEDPPTYTPENPPTIYGPEDKLALCCGLTGQTITFPAINDPWPVSDKPIAPHDPAVGAFQVLLDRGAFFLNEVDMAVPAPALPVAWGRAYVSDLPDSQDGLLGRNWDFTFDIRLVPMGRDIGNGLRAQTLGAEKARVTLYDGRGRGEIYAELHTEKRIVQNFEKTFQAVVTTFVSPPGQFHELERYVLVGPHSDHPFGDHPNVAASEQIFYVLREKNGTRLVFNCRGQLIYMLSRHDNPFQHVRIDFRYDGPLNPLTGNKVLSRLIDVTGRALMVTTVDIGKAPVLTNIDCALVATTLPIPRIKSVAGPGFTVTYAYRNGDADQTLEQAEVRQGDVTRVWRYATEDRRRITEIRDPNGVAGAGPYIVNAYVAGRVARQTMAGQVRTLLYEGSKVTVTAATGDVTEFALQKAGPYMVREAVTVRGADAKLGGPWTTRYAHNAFTQVTRVDRPGGGATSFEFDPANGPLIDGPYKDWVDRGLFYENDLSQGNLLAVTEIPSGKGAPITTRSTYEPVYNQLATTTNARGATTTYSYDHRSAADRGEPLTESYSPLTQADGSTLARPPVRYRYNFRGQRVSADYGRSGEALYTFDPATGAMQGVTWPSRAFQTLTLDSQGLVVRQTSSDGVVAFRRDGAGRIVEKVFDPAGAAVKTTYAYDPNGNVVALTQEIKDVFDAESRAASGAKPGPVRKRVVRTRFDVLNRPLEETVEAEGLTQATRWSYGPNGVESKTTPSRNDGAPLRFTYAYDARGLEVANTEGDGLPEAIVTRTTYDADGHPLQIQRSAKGLTETLTQTYDGYGRPATLLNPSGAETRWEYDAGGGAILAEVRGPAGPGKGQAVLSRTHYRYNTLGDLMSRTRDDLRGGQQTAQWIYDESLRVSRVIGPDGGEVSYERDLDGRVTRSTDPTGGVTETSYDPAGRPVRVVETVQEQTVDPASGKLAPRTGRYVTTYRYDSLGDLVAASGPGSSNERRLYDSTGALRGLFVPGEGLTLYEYDGLGRRTALRQGERFETTEYTAGGLAKASRSPLGGKAYGFDALGRTISVTDLTTGAITRFEVDGFGREIKKIDANGSETVTSRDTAGRPVQASIRYASVKVKVGDLTVEGADGVRSKSFDYDGLDRLVAARTGQGSEVQTVYDGLDNPVQETQIFRGMGQTIRRRFDPAGAWRETTLPELSGRAVVRYEFDPLGRVEVIGFRDSPIRTTVYASADRVATHRFGNGSEARFAYDSSRTLTAMAVAQTGGATAFSAQPEYRRGRMSALLERQVAPIAGTPPRTSRTEIEYDAYGRAVSMRSQGWTAPTPESDPPDYAVVSLNQYAGPRLTRSAEALLDDKGGVRTLRVDELTYAAGRVTAARTRGSTKAETRGDPETVDEAVALLSKASAVADQTARLAYDAVGNLLYDGRFIYSWDADGRLTGAADTWRPYRYDESVAFTYDALGRRIYISPRKENQTSGLMSFAPEWDRYDQWHVYDGKAVVQEAWVNHPKAGQKVSLLATYVLDEAGRRFRMDRRPEADPKGPLQTFYLHEGVQGEIRLATNAGGVPLFAANAEASAGDGGAPGRPPGDAVMIYGSTVRLPYSSAFNRLDSFAAVAYAEDQGLSPLSQRAAWAWTREVDAEALRQDRLAYQNRLMLKTLALASVPLTAGASAGYLGGAAFTASVLMGGAVNLGLNAGAAWWTSSGYALEDGVNDFAIGAVNGMSGALVEKAAWSVVSELAMNYAVNYATDTYTGYVDGKTLADAATESVSSAAFGAGLGFVVGKVSNTAMGWASRRSNAMKDAVRPSAVSGSAPESAAALRVDTILRQTNKELRTNDIWLAKDVAPATADVGAFKSQVMHHLRNGTEFSKLVAQVLEKEKLQVRVSPFGDTDAYAVWHRASPELLHINNKSTFIDPFTGRAFSVTQSPLMMASLILHEAAHALGGDEMVAHTAQAKFLQARVERFNVNLTSRRLTLADRPLLDEGHLSLIEAIGADKGLEEIAIQVLMDRDYKLENIVWRDRTMKYIQDRGWAEILGVDPKRFKEIRSMIQREVNLGQGAP